ncbi:hypothetical protein AB0L67_38580 [Streptomyces flaveolus]|uniref:hypothetical protein n=1 Tax=Streptomyces flaveolus TaxID=67297 RepID=UPI003435F63B
MEPTDVVGIHPTRLDPAPAPPARAVAFPDAGPRWGDLCRDHGMAARRRSRLPATPDGIGEDLWAAAREAGLPGAARLAFSR